MAKSKPYGIRFELERLNFLMTRQNISSAQRAVDFLLNKYWETFKVETGNPFVESAKPVCNSSQLPTTIIDESQMFSQPKPKLLFRSFDNYRQLRIECPSEEEWMELKSEIMAATYLTSKQKTLLTS